MLGVFVILRSRESIQSDDVLLHSLVGYGFPVVLQEMSHRERGAFDAVFDGVSKHQVYAIKHGCVFVGAFSDIPIPDILVLSWDILGKEAPRKIRSNHLDIRLIRCRKTN